MREDWYVRWIVDGMNVIGSVPDGWWRDRAAARRRLVAQLGQLRGRPDVESVEVVFDGTDSPDLVAEGEALGVAVRFAGPGANAADRVIAAEVAADDRPEDITVATSDAALAAAVRASGAAVIGSSAFRRELGG